MISWAIRWVTRALAIAGAVVAIDSLVVQPWRANRILVEIDARTLRAFRAAPFQRLRLARTSLDQLATLNLFSRSVDGYIHQALNHRLADDPYAAIGSYDAALKIDQRPELYLERGRTLAGMGRMDEARRDVLYAVAFNPRIVESIDDPLFLRQVEKWVRPPAGGN